MSIREARPGDAAVVAELNSMLFQEDAGRRDPSMDLDWPVREGARYFAEVLRTPGNAVFLAEEMPGPVGYLAARWHSAGGMRRVAAAELESMFVVGQARGAGVGSGLVCTFRSWATRRNAGRMVVTAYAENHSALRFYRRFGFDSRKITLDSECVVGE